MANHNRPGPRFSMYGSSSNQESQARAVDLPDCSTQENEARDGSDRFVKDKYQATNKPSNT
ncbi:hypothetical protein UNDKW_1863 [Undibacterium sp. KW1]|nr:hypothetical protein UNDKW_1863 [Undibacterium sp. KW1]